MRAVGSALSLLILATSNWGCGGNGAGASAVPDSLLVDVIVDVYSATARAHLDGSDPNVARAEALERFGLDTAAFNSTLEYLAANPDSAAAVYQRALDSLIIIERNLKSGPELDSLRRHLRG